MSSTSAEAATSSGDAAPPHVVEDLPGVLRLLSDGPVIRFDDYNPWLVESADFGRVFVSGDSAGGNIVHHVAVRLGSGQLAVDPARVAGHVMLCPLFGGVRRTASEAEFPPGPFVSLPVCDQG